MSDSKIIREQIEVYRPSFLEHGDSPRATFHNAREQQELRFERMTRPLMALKRPFSILDVGAGLCDLHGFLRDRGIEHGYAATEIVPEMVDHARKKYPGIDVSDRNILDSDPVERPDFVVASGVFNIPGKVARDEWERFVEKMVRRMYAISTGAIAFSFLTSNRTFTDPSLHYTDTGAMFDLCVRELSRFVIVDHAYPLFECTMTVIRPGLMRRTHPGPVYGRYFPERDR